MFSTFDLCLLLYVIRLAGWLKHCNLSLSLPLSHESILAMPLSNQVHFDSWISQDDCNQEATKA